MATTVTTKCVCDWCGATIKERRGDCSNDRLAVAVVKLDCDVVHMRWWGDDLCADCAAELRALKAAKEASKPRP